MSSREPREGSPKSESDDINTPKKDFLDINDYVRESVLKISRESARRFKKAAEDQEFRQAQFQAEFSNNMLELQSVVRGLAESLSSVAAKVNALTPEKPREQISKKFDVRKKSSSVASDSFGLDDDSSEDEIVLPIRRRLPDVPIQSFGDRNKEHVELNRTMFMDRINTPLRGDPRRDSILQRHNGKINASGNDRYSTGIRYTQALPSFDYISLKFLSAEHVFRFIMQVQEYIAKYATIPPAATLIEKNVRLRIRDKASLSEPELLNQSWEDLILILADASRVITPEEFRSTLQRIAESIFDKSKYQELNTVTFYNFYYNLKRYFEDMSEAYEFLLLGSEDSAVPLLNGKEEGIIQLLLDNIPCRYGRKVFNKMKTKRYSSLSEFIKAFMVFARSDFEAAALSKKLADSLRGDDKGSRHQNHDAAPAPTYRKPFVKPKHSLHNMYDHIPAAPIIEERVEISPCPLPSRLV